jgi:hypothetical protein
MLEPWKSGFYLSFEVCLSRNASSILHNLLPLVFRPPYLILRRYRVVFASDSSPVGAFISAQRELTSPSKSLAVKYSDNSLQVDSTPSNGAVEGTKAC